VAPLDSALDLSMELDWAVLLGTAGRAPAKPDGVVRVLCACGRVSDVGRKCLCGRAPTARDARSRGVCSPGSAIVALVVHVSVPWLVVHGCDVPPGPFGLPVWTRDWADPKITFHDRIAKDLLPM
jgi:hypothetical protein